MTADNPLRAAMDAHERNEEPGHTRTRRHWCPRHHQFEEVREYAVALSAPRRGHPMTAEPQPLTDLRAPRTEPGRKLLALWLAGRTHPPSVQRLRDFTELVLAIEDETDAALREQLAATRAALQRFRDHFAERRSPNIWCEVHSAAHLLAYEDRCENCCSDPAPPPPADAVQEINDRG